MLRIAIIDDDEIYRLYLQNKLSTKTLQCELYDNFDSFFDTLIKSPNSFHAIVVDRLVGTDDAVKHRFPESCRRQGYEGAIILYSNYASHHTSQNLLDPFDKVLRKGDPIDWQEAIAQAITNRGSSKS